MSLARKWSRIGGVTAVGVLVVTSGSMASAVTPSPFASESPTVSQSLSSSGSNCTKSLSSTAPTVGPLNSNAGPLVVASTTAGTVTNGNVSGDVSQVSVSDTASLKETSTGALPVGFHLKFSGHGTVNPAAGHSPSGCGAGGQALVEYETTVTLTKPELLTVSSHLTGSGAVIAAFVQPSNGSAVEIVGVNSGYSGSAAAFEPAGTYMLEVEAGTIIPSSTTATSKSAAGAIDMTFTPGGSRIAGPTGAAKGFVTLGAARACAAHTLVSHVTSNRGNASQIASASIFGNGKLLKRVTAPHVGSAITAHMPDGVAEKVKAVVALKNGQRLTETASYLQCS